MNPLPTFALGLATIGIFAFAALSEPASLRGQAIVTDGDTIRIGSTRVRLAGIDAPELSQKCTIPNVAVWACGQTAKEHLQELIGGAEVSCESQGKDRYARKLAKCFVGINNLNATMVLDGYALAYRRYSTGYVWAEDYARSAKRGIWSTDFINPEQYRREHKR